MIFEGGYVLDELDPGGETKYGISKRYYPHVNIKALTKKQEKEIYKNNGRPPWRFMGKKVLPYEVKNSIDIHNNIDLEIARLIINRL